MITKLSCKPCRNLAIFSSQMSRTWIDIGPVFLKTKNLLEICHLAGKIFNSVISLHSGNCASHTGSGFTYFIIHFRFSKTQHCTYIVIWIFGHCSYTNHSATAYGNNCGDRTYCRNHPCLLLRRHVCSHTQSAVARKVLRSTVGWSLANSIWTLVGSFQSRNWHNRGSCRCLVHWVLIVVI